MIRLSERFDGNGKRFTKNERVKMPTAKMTAGDRLYLAAKDAERGDAGR